MNQSGYARGARTIPEARRSKKAATANTTVLVRFDALGKWTCNDNNAAKTRSNPTSVMSTRLENGSGAAAILRRNLLVYGVGGVIIPFVGIKIIDMLLVGLRLA